MTTAMMTVIIIVLFLSQLLTFYFLVILNSKISKYKDIEKKQETIIREMDDAISAYLVEVKDENDRLIKELKANTSEKSANNSNERKNETENTASPITELNEGNQQLTFGPNVGEDIKVNQEVPKIVPKTFATNAYKKQIIESKTTKAESPVKQEQVEEAPVDQILSKFEQQVVKYYKSGMSIEEIAKKTQKGKTEIELLIKFHA